MGVWGWVLLVVGVCVVIGVMQAIAQSDKHKAQENALSTLPEFTPSVVHKGLGGGGAIAIDVERRKFAISNGAHDTKVFEFSQLVAVEVLRNGTSIQKTNRGSQVAGAAIGAVLLGPFGLLLGGLTGSKRSVEKVDKLSLKVFTNDLVRPVHEIVFHNLAGSKPDSFIVKNASQELDSWHGRLQTILVMGERAA